MKPSDYQQGKRDALEEVILLSNHHTNINSLTKVLRNMVDQHRKVFYDEEYLNTKQ